MNELKPCSYCEETNLLFEHADMEPQAFVTCRRCGMMGPMRMEDIDAIGAWNALPRALVWTSEPPQLSAWNWWWIDVYERPVCRYVYGDGSIDNLMIGRIAWQDIGGQWCPIPEPQEPRP